MIKDIITKDKLVEKAKKIKNKGFKPGIDNMTAATAIIWLEINGDKLCRQLVKGNYEPLPLSGFTIAKNDGRPRVVSKLTAIDSVIQGCILDGLNGSVDDKFSKYSFAYRQNKGLTDAVSLFCTLGAEHKFAAKLDPASCYDNIDRDILAENLRHFVDDEELVSLIMSFVNAPLILENELVKSEKGIPQGSPLSPFLCNVYLSTVDALLESKSIDFIRYADDIIVFADTDEEISEYAELVKSEMQDKLKLKLNLSKYKVSAPSDMSFLGHRFEKKHSGLVAEQKKSRTGINYSWTESEVCDNRRTVDIVSDGILHQKDFSLVFETEDGDLDVPVRETNIINVYSDVILDSGVLKKLSKNGITLNVFSAEDNLLGRFVPNKGLHSASVIFEQIEAYYDPSQRLEIAREFLLASFHNTRLVIRYYNKKCENEIYKKALNRIDRIYAEIRTCDNYENLLLLEAKGRAAYYECFDSFLEGTGFEFCKRSKRTPENRINALISFGNTLLYNYIATEINKSSLDVRVGFLHATNKRTESLNLDIAEMFKPLIVDRLVFTLINRRKLTAEDFAPENGGLYLNQEGKRIFISSFYEKLDTTLQIKDRNMSYRQIIHEEVQKLIRRFRDGEKYKPYKQVR